MALVVCVSLTGALLIQPRVGSPAKGCRARLIMTDVPPAPPDDSVTDCLVVGAGYIAVEMAGILNALGCDTTLAVRGDKALRAFDELLSTTLDAEMKRAGMKIATGTTLAKVELVDGKKVVTTTDGATLGPFDEVLMAVGRKPLVEPLKLENAGVDLNDKGYVAVDEYQRTTAMNFSS